MPRFGHTGKTYTYQGHTGTLHALYQHFHWAPTLNTIRFRMRKGMTLQQAVETPLNDYQSTHPALDALNKANLAQRLQQGKQAHRIARQRLSSRPLHERTCHPASIRDAYMTWTGAQWELK
jgi:hypothetical protein